MIWWKTFVAETGVQSLASPCGTCGGRIGTRKGSSPRTSFFHCPYFSIDGPHFLFHLSPILCNLGNQQRRQATKLKTVKPEVNKLQKILSTGAFKPQRDIFRINTVTSSSILMRSPLWLPFFGLHLPCFLVALNKYFGILNTLTLCFMP